MRAQTSVLHIIVLNFLIFALLLNHDAWNISGVKKRVKIRTFVSPVKNRGGLVERSVRIIGATPWF